MPAPDPRRSVPQGTRAGAEPDAVVADLHARCVLILDACAAAEPGPWSAELRDVVARMAAKRSAPGLRALLREFRGMAAALPVGAQRELAAELRRRFGLDPGAARDGALVAKVRARGRIRSEREYRLVAAYANAVAGDPSAHAEYQALGALLDGYMAAPEPSNEALKLPGSPGTPGAPARAVTRDR